MPNIKLEMYSYMMMHDVGVCGMGILNSENKALFEVLLLAYERNLLTC